MCRVCPKKPAVLRENLNQNLTGQVTTSLAQPQTASILTAPSATPQKQQPTLQTPQQVLSQITPPPYDVDISIGEPGSTGLPAFSSSSVSHGQNIGQAGSPLVGQQFQQNTFAPGQGQGQYNGQVGYLPPTGGQQTQVGQNTFAPGQGQGQAGYLLPTGGQQTQVAQNTFASGQGQVQSSGQAGYLSSTGGQETQVAQNTTGQGQGQYNGQARYLSPMQGQQTQVGQNNFAPGQGQGQNNGQTGYLFPTGGQQASQGQLQSYGQVAAQTGLTQISRSLGQCQVQTGYTFPTGGQQAQVGQTLVAGQGQVGAQNGFTQIQQGSRSLGQDQVQSSVGQIGYSLQTSGQQGVRSLVQGHGQTLPSQHIVSLSSGAQTGALGQPSVAQQLISGIYSSGQANRVLTLAQNKANVAHLLNSGVNLSGVPQVTGQTGLILPNVQQGLTGVRQTTHLQTPYPSQSALTSLRQSSLAQPAQSGLKPAILPQKSFVAQSNFGSLRQQSNAYSIPTSGAYASQFTGVPSVGAHQVQSSPTQVPSVGSYQTPTGFQVPQQSTFGSLAQQMLTQPLASQFSNAGFTPQVGQLDTGLQLIPSVKIRQSYELSQQFETITPFYQPAVGTLQFGILGQVDPIECRTVCMKKSQMNALRLSQAVF